MPKIVDYPSRVDELREAVYDEILECGTRRLSVPRIAERMRLSLSTLKRLLRSSDDLPHLAVQAVQRRHQSRWIVDRTRSPLALEPWQRALRALLRRLPFDEDERADMLVWRAALGAAPDAEWAAVAELERVEELDTLVRRLLESLGCDDTASRDLLRLLVDGFVEAVSTRRLAPGQARAFLETHVARLAGDASAA